MFPPPPLMQQAKFEKSTIQGPVRSSRDRVAFNLRVRAQSATISNTSRVGSVLAAIVSRACRLY